MQSLVQRQFRSVVPGIVLTLLTVGIVVDLLVAKKLEKEFDALLIAKSSGLIALTETSDEGFEVEHYEVTLPNYTDIENADYFEFRNDAGETIEKSLSLNDDAFLVDLHAEQSAKFLNVVLPDGRDGRVIRTRFLPRVDFDPIAADSGSIELAAKILEFPGSSIDANTIAAISGLEALERAENFRRIPLTLQLASSRENLDSLIRSIHFLFIAAGLFTTGLILIVLSRGTNRAMLPLKELGDQVADIDELRLDKQLALHEPVAELSLLTDRFNFLLSRLQYAFAQEKRFTGDMAHELRTPVSEIRSLLDVHKQWPDDPELQKTFIEDVDTATSRMQRIIGNLLALARAQTQSAGLRVNDNLGQVVRHRANALIEQAVERKITFNLDLPTAPISAAGCDQWTQIIDNLLGNAVAHGTYGSVVDVRLSRAVELENRCVLEVSNDTGDLEEQDLPVMFERMWQKDPSRTSDQHGGLGLALVLAYAEQIDASLESDLIDGRLTLRILFTCLA